MNRTEHLFTILSEECSEVSHRASKILRFGLHEVQPGQSKSNEERFLTEFCELLGVMKMLEDDGILKPPDPRPIMKVKKERVEKFLEYSKKQGTLGD